jgi:hypothetical protein
MQLRSLSRLADLAGDAERSVALGHLASMILSSREAVWGIDFPFALPLEVVDAGATFADQLEAVARFGGDAYAFGRACVERARALGGEKLHLRRDTDRETKTPFDCYHYRIVCQTFHGMRDVLRKIVGTPGTIVPPFDQAGAAFERAVVETCPGSTLKRWGAPHNNYKQPAGGPLEPKRLRTRKVILQALSERVAMSPAHVRVIQRNGGGDALDAVLAAAGTWEAWQAADWDAIERHPRYPREGRIFA